NADWSAHGNARAVPANSGSRIVCGNGATEAPRRGANSGPDHTDGQVRESVRPAARYTDRGGFGRVEWRIPTPTAGRESVRSTECGRYGWRDPLPAQADHGSSGPEQYGPAAGACAGADLHRPRSAVAGSRRAGHQTAVEYPAPTADRR